jgi:hypothetical protein
MSIVVKILRNDRPKPVGKLADAEIHFLEGELAGLKLVGFAIWERRDGPGRNVTFPARQFTVHGERRNFSLIRTVADPSAQDHLREIVLRAYSASQHEMAESATA